MTAIVTILSIVVIFQFIVIMILVGGREESNGKMIFLSPIIKSNVKSEVNTEMMSKYSSVRSENSENAEIMSELSVRKIHDGVSADNIDRIEYEGVAVTTFLGAPKWFQNRYSMMVNQIISVIGDRHTKENENDTGTGNGNGTKTVSGNRIKTGWVVQIFYQPKNKMSVEGTMYPGIQRLVRRGQVVLTPIPDQYKKLKKKALMREPWLWESMLADRVLIFGGNVVLCANSPLDLSSFNHYDYIGTPWSSLKGVGGEGDLSVRNRTKILGILQKNIPITVMTPGSDREDAYYVKGLMDLKKEHTSDSLERSSVILATSSDTHGFAMSGKKGYRSLLGTIGASGTLLGLNDTDRQTFINYCPEIKMLFPSLHSPHCFGSDPDPLGCFKYLCQAGGLQCRNRINKNNGKPLSVSWTDIRNSDNIAVEMRMNIEMIVPEKD